MRHLKHEIPAYAADRDCGRSASPEFEDLDADATVGVTDAGDVGRPMNGLTEHQGIFRRRRTARRIFAHRRPDQQPQTSPAPRVAHRAMMTYEKTMRICSYACPAVGVLRCRHGCWNGGHTSHVLGATNELFDLGPGSRRALCLSRGGSPSAAEGGLEIVPRRASGRRHRGEVRSDRAVVRRSSGASSAAARARASSPSPVLRRRSAVELFLEGAGCREPCGAACGDLDRLAGRGVASLSGRAVGDGELAEAGDRDVAAGGELTCV